VVTVTAVVTAVSETDIVDLEKEGAEKREQVKCETAENENAQRDRKRPRTYALVPLVGRRPTIS